MQSLSDEQISFLLKKPVLIWKYTGTDESLICETQKYKSNAVESFIGQLLKYNPISGLLKKNSDVVTSASMLPSDEENDCCNLETAWHAIHYMLTKSVYDGDFPMNFLLSGGDEVGSIDVGFGPARVMRSSQVKEIHTYLSSLPTEVFMTSYNADNLTKDKIYPEIWYRFYAEDENRAYVSEKFEIMKEMVEKVVQHHNGLLLWISPRSMCSKALSQCSVA
jgi:hypothetical protein